MRQVDILRRAADHADDLLLSLSLLLRQQESERGAGNADRELVEAVTYAALSRSRIYRLAGVAESETAEVA